MKTLELLLILLLATFSMSAADTTKKVPEPAGQPVYQRQGDGWIFGCWIYEKSRAVHGRLRNKDGEVVGKKIGETIETTFGTLIWRGPYSPGKSPDKSTGWLFIESFSGPPYIRDRYDPKTGTLPQ